MIYLDFFEDVKSTIWYIQQLENRILTTDETREVIERLAKAYEINIVEAEFSTIIKNLEYKQKNAD